jgi:hypothetical protein
MCFCEEVVFQYELPFDYPSLTRWRKPLGFELSRRPSSRA